MKTLGIRSSKRLVVDQPDQTIFWRNPAKASIKRVEFALLNCASFVPQFAKNVDAIPCAIGLDLETSDTCKQMRFLRIFLPSYTNPQ